MGANDLIRAGISKDVVLKELESNYKMLEKLNKENSVAINNNDLDKLSYSKADIEKALIDEPNKTIKCK